MGLFSKKEEKEEIEGIPKLPELPSPKNFSIKSNLPEIPTGIPAINSKEVGSPALLPDIKEKSSQEVIKQIINKPEISEPITFQKPIKKETIRTIELEPSKTEEEFIKPVTKKIEPIYIRLDKFQIAIGTFEEIKNKIIEIEELLKKTKETKIKEEQELTEWETEIQVIKAKIDSIDKNIFSKLD